jgi:hypothetical protein
MAFGHKPRIEIKYLIRILITRIISRHYSLYTGHRQVCLIHLGKRRTAGQPGILNEVEMGMKMSRCQVPAIPVILDSYS